MVQGLQSKVLLSLKVGPKSFSLRSKVLLVQGLLV